MQKYRAYKTRTEHLINVFRVVKYQILSGLVDSVRGFEIKCGPGHVGLSIPSQSECAGPAKSFCISILPIEWWAGILQNEKVDADELEKVKNYMLGSYLEDLGNIFQMSSLYLSYLQQGLTLQDYYEAIAAIRNASINDVLDCAQKYFDKNKMVEVAVG